MLASMISDRHSAQAMARGLKDEEDGRGDAKLCGSGGRKSTSVSKDMREVSIDQ